MLGIFTESYGTNLIWSVLVYHYFMSYLYTVLLEIGRLILFSTETLVPMFLLIQQSQFLELLTAALLHYVHL